MVIWLASWPQSGSTMLRWILKDVFAQHAYSEYEEPRLEWLFGPKMDEFVKGWCLSRYLQLREDPGEWYVKTHSVPKQITDDPVIWTCRDGRNAISALARFYGVRAYELILGQNIQFADWTTFYRAWNPLARPNTLILKYEQLCDDTAGQIERISQFINKPIIGEFQSRRDEAHRWYPQLFKRTPTRYQEVMTADEQELFWEFHGQTMKDLGYEP